MATTPGHGGEGVLPPASDDVPFEGYQSEGYAELSPDAHGLWTGATAPIESTGTWLRRGFWYAETEAVIWNRLWNRDDKLMAAEDASVNSPNFFSPTNPFPVFNTNRLMYLQSSHPGQDGSVRATLGHFFIRDAKNRDHTGEFTAFGGGEWQQEQVMTAANPDVAPLGLQVPFYIDGLNRSFDDSRRQTIEYESNFSSFEANYRVKGRMGRDQIIMDPNGQWHRAANPGFEREYMAGLRYMELTDQLDWRAEDIAVLGNDGSYVIHTDNDMFGFQMGAGLTFQASRWSLGTTVKGGVFVNDASGRTVLNFTDADGVDDDNDDDADLFMRDDELSFIGEFKLLGRFHVTPSISLRAAYEIMYLESVALAPSQATFITETAFLNSSGDPVYHGASFGIEGYW
jgi:hypothetical protein